MKVLSGAHWLEAIKHRNLYFKVPSNMGPFLWQHFQGSRVYHFHVQINKKVFRVTHDVRINIKIAIIAH